MGDLRETMRAGRREGATWVRLADTLRALASRQGRASLYTRIVHGHSIHQVSGHTQPDRFPMLFDLTARLRPDAARILSFGCSTGEEIEALRRRFPGAAIVGAEINPHSRRLARHRMAGDARVRVVGPNAVEGRFDLIFALAVLQVRPDWVAEAGIVDVSRIYPFERFDNEVARLFVRLAPDGLLCVFNAQYRVEDSSVAMLLEPIADSPPLVLPIFDRDGKRYEPSTVGRSLFRRS